MTDQEQAEVIALCEDPDEDFSDVESRPATSEERALVESIADGMFLRLTADDQVEDLLQLPPHVSARLVAQMPESRREHVLSQIPTELAQDILSLSPVGVV